MIRTAIRWRPVAALALAAPCLAAASQAPADAPPDPARAALVAEIARTAQEYPALAASHAFAAALDATVRIDRRDFVPKAVRRYAYRDDPLPIGYAQTISDPYIVAVMTAAVGSGPGTRVLEIGTGSGYQAAVLARVGARVHTIEIVAPLARAAAKRLRRLGYKGIDARAGDGFAGWPEAAPFDAIIVTAGTAAIPPALLAQLAPGGRMVIPLGANPQVEQLVLIAKRGDGSIAQCSLGPAAFVPLTGRGQTREIPATYDRTVPLCYKGQTARWPGQEPGAADAEAARLSSR